jgi:DNA-directed RNA polymerase specialized sigma24 family protein
MPAAPTYTAHGRFATTRWSMVTVACDASSLDGKAALERLCQDYWRPLFAFALRKANDFHLAQDLTQTFFGHFIERGYLRAADRARGKFRTFLLTCFEHFLVHEWEKARAIKRGGKFTLVSWEEHCSVLESRVTAEELPPQRQYDREWALAIMERALDHLQMEFVAAGKDRDFQLLRHFLHAEARAGEYLRVSSELKVTEGAVKLFVHRMRRRYGSLLRDEVRDTVASELDVEDEMRYIVELMSA